MCLRAEPRTESGQQRREHNRGRRQRDSADQPLVAPGRAREHVDDATRRLFVGGGADLARGQERDDRRDHQEGNAEILIHQ